MGQICRIGIGDGLRRNVDVELGVLPLDVELGMLRGFLQDEQRLFVFDFEAGWYSLQIDYDWRSFCFFHLTGFIKQLR